MSPSFVKAYRIRSLLCCVSRHRYHTMSLPRIELTPTESLFRRCLLDFRDEAQSIPGMQGLELRWTGGWVRDKLLGVQSHDIDIALSSMTGEKFGLAFRDFMSEHGNKYVQEAKSKNLNSEIKGLQIIAANPEKSKNLETAHTTMFGIDIDIVNLRKEIYTEHSRNPQIEFGTPEEDALRRDATINAMFYHLDKQEIEDYTGRGLDDMQKHIIRTPLAPYQTFKDDPLRVLRLIRFACRLGYEIESTALEAMKDKTVHEALRIKISRERVGVEVGKIMTGPDPYGGLMRIYDCDLFEAVFANPFLDRHPSVNTVPIVYKYLQEILDKPSSGIYLGLHLKDDPNTVWSLATYVPWNTESEKTVVAAARESIRAINPITKVLGESIRHREKIHSLVEAVSAGSATRGVVGMTLRKAGVSWRYHVLYSLLCDVVSQDFVTVIGKYTKFLEYVQSQKLEDAPSLKHIINGNEVKEALGIVKAGPWLTGVLDVLIEWQYEHPRGTVEEARAMLSERRGELNLG